MTFMISKLFWRTEESLLVEAGRHELSGSNLTSSLAIKTTKHIQLFTFFFLKQTNWTKIATTKTPPVLEAVLQAVLFPLFQALFPLEVCPCKDAKLGAGGMCGSGLAGWALGGRETWALNDAQPFFGC